MFYHNKRLQYPVSVEKPDPMYARLLQQAIGGVDQQQWLAVIEELGGDSGALPIPNSFPQSQEDTQNSYNFYDTGVEGSEAPARPLELGDVHRRQGRVQRVQEPPIG